MLKKLFRPLTQAKWQHEDAAIRLKAIEQMDSQQTAILEKLAIEDDHAQVRDKALGKITNKASLLKLAQNSQYAASILKRWTEVLSDTQLTSAYDAEQIITGCTDADHLAAVISYSPNKAFAELAIAGLNNETQLLQLMQSSKSSRLWQQVIAKLHNIDDLKQAEVIVKGRDKGALQKIRQKIETIEKHNLAERALQDEQQRLLDKVTQLNSSQAAVHLQGEILNLQQQSQSLVEKDTANSISAESQAQFKQQLEALTDKLTTQQQLKAEEQESTQRQQLSNALESQLTTIQTALQQNSLDKPTLQQSQDDFNALNFNDAEQSQSLNKLSTQVEKLFALASDLQSAKTLSLNSISIEKLNSKNIEEHLQHCSDYLTRCKQLNIDSAIKDQLSSIQTQLKQQQQQQLQNSQQTEQKLAQLLIDTENLLADNDAAGAKRQLKQIKTYSETLNKQQLNKHQAALSRIHKSLHALEDWKTYSTDPKREALIASMNSLSSETLTAEIRLAKIKDLQAQWKSLGYCQNQSLWKTFQKASDTAYAPCQENFEQQKNMRNFNAQQRTTICEQLEHFINERDFTDSALDWKNIEKLNRNIINEWKKFSPVEPKQHKTLQKRFSTSLDAINNAIHQQQLNTETQLKSLCDNAQQLNEQEDKHEAIKAFQQLMQQWKTTSNQGISRHKQQQLLWAEFKQAGDTLYEGRQNQFQTAEKESQDNATQANALIDSISQLTNSIKAKTQQTIGEDLKALKEAQQSFHAIGSLPKNQFKAIKQHFEQACEASNSAIEQASNNSWLEQLKSLIDFGQQCTAAEQNNNASTELIPTSFNTQWKDALQARFNTQETAEDFNKKARSICINIEKLYGIATPESDSALKMELQMQQLADNFGHQSSQSHNEALEALYLKWFAIPCWDQEQHQELEQRFLAATEA